MTLVLLTECFSNIFKHKMLNMVYVMFQVKRLKKDTDHFLKLFTVLILRKTFSLGIKYSFA